LLQPAFKLLLMHAPFRLCRQGGPGFAPGLRASLACMWRGAKHALFDQDRLKYWVVRWRQALSCR
jgi:hypothetical protein